MLFLETQNSTWCPHTLMAILIYHISNKAKLHQLFANKRSANICPICENEVETLRHFILHCTLKCAFWFIALPKFNAPPDFSLD
ncbi:hypothetical protein BDA99DRAFT_493885 [Phascolomyces articulosus]|uniref:Reverse transcriptase zinc-binding domain-containing protein n=1 Tax=Phascolomyces articulosus TaxID=60185 RepID=A0AAD5KA56_9FUNG|nr:hypothetical protein BDA99DRAFT_493885 [Phascolomyces articulosus]